MPKFVGVDKSHFEVGQVVELGNSALPFGLLPCDGTSYPTATYPVLFSKIGYAFGGAGASFDVPDYRGRTAIGDGTGSGLTARTRGQQTIGAETHSLTAAQSGLRAHDHPITDPTHDHSTSPDARFNTSESGTDVFAAGGINGDNSTNLFTSSVSTGITVNDNTALSGSAHNNMQPSLVVKFGIAYI